MERLLSSSLSGPLTTRPRPKKMKTLISRILFGKDRISGLIALAIVGSIALGCNCGKGLDFSNIGANSNRASSNANSDDSDTGDMPGDELLNALVKETTADFAYAISTEDFSKMYAKSSTDFQKSYTADQMKEVFKSTIANKRKLLPLLSKVVSMDPVYSPEPYIRTEQGLPILVVKGSYNTKPVPLKFSYEYVKRNGQFKLLKLVIGDEDETS